MTRSRIVALAFLLASLVANGALVRALTRGDPPSAAAGPALVAGAAGGGGRTRGEQPQSQAAPAACGPEVAALEQEVAGNSQALRGLAPARAIFAQGAPNPEAEARLAPLAAAALERVSPREGQRLTCRDVACQLVFQELASVGEDAADQALARHAELSARIGALEPEPPATVRDPGTRRIRVQRTVYFKLNAAREPAPPAHPGRPQRKEGR